MSRDDKQVALLFALIGIGAWLWFTRSGKAVAASAGESVATGVECVTSALRGERNNNPGNIRISANTWAGKLPASQNTDGAFEQFDTVENGIRALAQLLIAYNSKYGLNTVRAIINRYAPPSENITDSYVNAVANSIGVSADAPIAVRDPATLFELAKAIIRHENGRVAYNDEIIREGVNRALV